MEISFSETVALLRLFPRKAKNKAYGWKFLFLKLSHCCVFSPHGLKMDLRMESVEKYGNSAILYLVVELRRSRGTLSHEDWLEAFLHSFISGRNAEETRRLTEFPPDRRKE